jgi:hypothetical protein
LKTYPSKLLKYLKDLPPEQKQAKEKLFEQTWIQARNHGFQSARFWAMRQVVSGLTAQQIEKKIQQRLRNAFKKDSDQ